MLLQTIGYERGKLSGLNVVSLPEVLKEESVDIYNNLTDETPAMGMGGRCIQILTLEINNMTQTQGSGVRFTQIS
jgi:hypothetical protein